MSCNLSHAMIWQMRCTHKLPKLCSATLSSTFFERRTSTESELFFSFDMRWRYQICVAKCLYSYRDDLPKILFKITAQVCKKSFLFDVRRSKKSPLRLPGLLFRIQRRAIFVWPWKMVSVSVPYLFHILANELKDQNMASSFSRRRRHCSIGQSCYSMTSKRGIGWFLESSRAWIFSTRAFT